jgi:hypothetical protein
METQLTLKNKERLFAAEEFNVKAERELLTVVNISYTENTAGLWAKSVCDARDCFEKSKEHLTLITKAIKSI